jgi:hypothetical protein
MKRAFDLSPLVMGLLAGGIHILLYYPGMLSFDAENCQIPEARTWNISDEHPPLMTVIFAGWFQLGLKVSLLFVIQELLFWTGLALLLESVAFFVKPKAVDEVWRKWVVVAGLAIVSLPLVPYGFAAATFAKDTWMLIALLWGIQAFLRLQRLPERASLWAVLRMSLYFALAASFRHNSVILLPVACAAVAMVSWRMKSMFSSMMKAVMPIGLFFAIHFAVSPLVAIQGRQTVRFVLAADLILFQTLYGDELAMQVPVLERFLKPGYQDKVQFGHVVPRLGEFADGSLVQDPSLVPELRMAVRNLWMTHPWKMAKIKYESFAAALGLDWSFDVIFGRYAQQTTSNAEGVGNSASGMAEPLIHFFRTLGFKSVYRPVALGHVLWLTANVIGWSLALIFWCYSRFRDRRSAQWLILLSFPLAYSASYLIACPLASYRYMMPSSLLVQIYAGVMVASLVIKKAAKVQVPSVADAL